MAQNLEIDRQWYHNQRRGYYHYDIPKKRICEIMDKCIVVTDRQILNIIKKGKIE
jgi:hypothetical protein